MSTCKIKGLPKKVTLKSGEFTATLSDLRVQTAEDFTVKFTNDVNNIAFETNPIRIEENRNPDIFGVICTDNRRRP